MNNLKDIYQLTGIEFIQTLLTYEQERFDKNFVKGSVLEEINRDFGVFPYENPYPVYFVGDIREPQNKIIFVGINPGYDKEFNLAENQFLKEEGIFEGYCKHFLFYKKMRTGLLPYYANIGGFLKRMYGITEKIDWDWFQNNFINLELIPYHSKDANGLRINDVSYYKERYFGALIKLLDHIKPTQPIFINGFSNFEKYFKDPLFADLIQFEKHKNIWKGTINGYAFIGLPFLTRVAGGKDQLVTHVQEVAD